MKNWIARVLGISETQCALNFIFSYYSRRNGRRGDFTLLFYRRRSEAIQRRYCRSSQAQKRR